MDMKWKNKKPKTKSQPDKKQSLKKAADKILDRDEFNRKFLDKFKDKDNNLKDLF